MTVLIELCVDSEEAIDAALEGGADRLEVCVDLAVGGLTPPSALVEYALAAAPRAGVHALMRSSGDGFVVPPDQVRDLCERMATWRHEWPEHRLGFVVGAVRRDGELDEDAARAFRDAAGEAPLTFHRGIDSTRDPLAATRTLATLGFDRVLTTGAAGSVADVAGLAAMGAAAGERMTILGSGGVRAHSVVDIVTRAGLREVHMRAPRADGSGTDAAEVAAIVAALADAGLR
ncbi:copper homeostasis protein CutC [Demequina globuliformis]|uniref:copper homeostasis protein CutC n=1 Tax=Demequina globuliformis TaxID=676202 RepID=UPI000B271636|nr:copper homeostasis protein CutC [Demequina globuliformis]